MYVQSWSYELSTNTFNPETSKGVLESGILCNAICQDSAGMNMKRPGLQGFHHTYYSEGGAQ